MSALLLGATCGAFGAGMGACADVLGLEEAKSLVADGGLDSGDPAIGDSDVPDAAPSTHDGPDGAADADASPLDGAFDAGPKRAFETPLVFNGRFDPEVGVGPGGLAAADARCMEAAAAAFPGRTFVAWLSTETVTAASRLAGGGPWYVGTKYLGTLEDLTTNNLQTQLHEGPTGQLDGGLTVVWTGTESDGTSSISHCNDWTSADESVDGLVGTGGGQGSTWTSAAIRACDYRFHLYCFEK